MNTLKGLVWLIPSLAIIVATLWIYGLTKEVQKLRLEKSIEEIRTQTKLLLSEEKYRDSLDTMIASYEAKIKASNLRLETLQKQKAKSKAKFNEEITIIDNFNSGDDRIRALRTELSRKDSLPQ